jgi:hypothetical protein
MVLSKYAVYIVRDKINMKNSVIVSPSSHFVVITTIIVYALLAPLFFEMDNAYGAGTNFVVDNYKTTMTYSQQQQQVEEVDTNCKSPCSSSAEMCIAMCA